MSRWLLASLIVPFTVSCALPTENAERAPVPAVSTQTAIDLGEIDDAASAANAEASAEESAEPEHVFVPGGVFASLEALCDAQRSLIAPTLRTAQAQLAESGVEEKLEPRCERVAKAFENVAVELRAPFVEVAALEVETGFATETHVAVRTNDGWTAVPHASVISFHDDPGCFTIERDAGLSSVRVAGADAPSLVLVEKTARGAFMDYSEDNGDVSVKTFDDVAERNVTCSFDAGAFACGRPKVLSVSRVPSLS